MLVGGVSAEGQLIDGILRLALDENVSFTVVPVRVLLLVTRAETTVARYFIPLVGVTTISLALGVKKTLKIVTIDCAHVHWIRVDDLRLFLQIERILVTLDVCPLNLTIVLLGVGGTLLAGVGISHKSVCNASLLWLRIASLQRSILLL